MRVLRRVCLPALIVVSLLATPHLSSAHPLGNFSISHYTAIHLESDAVVLRYVIDMAEIPAFQERRKLRNEAVYARRTALRIAAGLRLSIDSKLVALTPVRQTVTSTAGQAGLRTLRLAIVLRAAAVAGEAQPAHDRGGHAVHLSEDELGGSRDLVGHGDRRRV